MKRRHRDAPEPKKHSKLNEEKEDVAQPDEIYDLKYELDEKARRVVLAYRKYYGALKDFANHVKKLCDRDDFVKLEDEDTPCEIMKEHLETESEELWKDTVGYDVEEIRRKICNI